MADALIAVPCVGDRVLARHGAVWLPARVIAVTRAWCHVRANDGRVRLVSLSDVRPLKEKVH